jgi:hypothetical protein
MHPTILGAMRANAGDLLKWHIDHAAHPQQIFLRLTVFPHGKISLRIEESAQQLVIYCSGFIPSFISKKGNPLDAFDRRRQVNLAARLMARHFALGNSPETLIVTLAARGAPRKRWLAYQML